MNGQGADRLYKLLPELYRWRDESHNKSLQVFLALIEQELHVLETDIAAMYENWFIQTCEDWVVPYIADLLGIRNAAHGDQLPFTQRRRVANTLAYRRRSGTISVLEQVMWDVTNWHVSACEFGHCLAITSHLRHSAPATAGSVRVRDTLAAAQLNDPLSRLGHTADIRRSNVRPLPVQAALLGKRGVRAAGCGRLDQNKPHCRPLSGEHHRVVLLASAQLSGHKKPAVQGGLRFQLRRRGLHISP